MPNDLTAGYIFCVLQLCASIEASCCRCNSAANFPSVLIHVRLLVTAMSCYVEIVHSFCLGIVHSFSRNVNLKPWRPLVHLRSEVQKIIIT